jgi:CRP-like cAMP-binding protein
MLTLHAPTMASYVRFLTRRIQFLNRKIRYLTAGSAEQRLALYLLSEIPEEGVPVRLEISAVSLADLLDLGRASLYRAMDRLSEDGFLVRNGHEYRLLQRDKLLTHYQ